MSVSINKLINLYEKSHSQNMIRFNDNIDNKYSRFVMILITDADSPSITNLLNNKYLLSG